MAAFNKFNVFTYDALAGKHDFTADSLKVALTNTAPTATDTTFSSLTEISAGNGYTAGGTASGTVTLSTSSGTAKLTCADIVFTASGGSIGPLQYAVLYNDTDVTKPLIGYWDYGSSITLADGETLTIDFDGTNGVLTIT